MVEWHKIIYQQPRGLPVDNLIVEAYTDNKYFYGELRKKNQPCTSSACWVIDCVERLKLHKFSRFEITPQFYFSQKEQTRESQTIRALHSKNKDNVNL